MGFESEIDVFWLAFESEWTTTYPGEPIAFPGVDMESFSKPNGPWAEFELSHADTAAIAAGPDNPPELTLVTVNAYFYDKPGVGPKPFAQRADALAAVWRGLAENGYWLRSLRYVDPLPSGRQGEGWVQAALLALFSREEPDIPDVSLLPGNPTITQSAHGLFLGDVIYRGSSSWAKSQADASATIAQGIVNLVRGAGRFDVLYQGHVTIPSHGLGTSGQAVYLSQSTPGAMTSTAPTTGLSQQVGVVIDANTIYFNAFPAIPL